MITLVDTNILLDIFGADPQFGQSSSELLRRCLKEGSVRACEMVWVETGTAFKDMNVYTEKMRTLAIEFSPTTEEVALLAAKIWSQYRRDGGKRERVAANFLIGAHAVIEGNRLLTRDKGFYRRYFKSLTILSSLK